VPADAVKITTLAEVVAISKESVVKILDALEMAMLVKGVEHEGRNRMLKKPKKWFFYSSSVRYILASPVSSNSDITGNLREDSVFRHLVASHDSLFYSHEADFIADGIRIEVGKSKKPRKGVVRFDMEEGIAIDKVPLPLFALSV
jgi:predicted AAA+ superfamily ATPase